MISVRRSAASVLFADHVTSNSTQRSQTLSVNIPMAGEWPGTDCGTVQ